MLIKVRFYPRLIYEITIRQKKIYEITTHLVLIMINYNPLNIEMSGENPCKHPSLAPTDAHMT